MKKDKGPDAFEKRYRELYGDRWPTLRQSLLDQEQKVGWRPFPELTAGEPYWIDPASLWAASLLQVQPGDAVLDACAAPGGKSLFLAAALQGEGTLVSNDPSPPRRERLFRVIRQYVPEEVRKKVVTITPFRAEQLKEKLRGVKRFDRILLDVPCSSERHVLKDPDALGKWSRKRVERIRDEQLTILRSVSGLAKAGGTLVYSTCSLSPEENDGTVERFLASREGSGWVSAPLSSEDETHHLEKTTYGAQLWPDRTAGTGPIFAARLRKEVE